MEDESTLTPESTRNNLHEGATSERIELFVSLIGRHQNQIHRYLLSLVPNLHDADDLFQETNLFLWREFYRFQEGTNFVSWGCSVAFHEVLAWRKRKSREKLIFTDAFLAAVSSELISGEDRLEERSQALASCVDKLPPHHRDLLQMRYAERAKVGDMASKLGRNSEAIYRMLSRIRHVLFECVNRRLEWENN